ncbi:MAG: class I SAM-dependent methyltransferase [Reyranella sp.]|uniref:class I SAM-dependent methyltransferase n=1 Tax=Reyranella sp. TaxID=1929291 RepID=UPI001AC9CDA8|nr:class I SAM-dependent methyltransferase [Reyranella sp.]MBN9091037.1 class I SAM-dependent methyltransferase [Reyranella sp.]
MSLSAFPVPEPDIDPLELYAAAIDTSDYVARVAPQVRRLVPDIGKLLDVGAGGGQFGASLQDRTFPWTAIEPSPTMRARLQRLHAPPHLVVGGWEEAWIARQSHDTVLAATMPAFFDHTEAFLTRCRDWARRTVVWVVPAQAGPRGLVFAGCLPSDWHREDETPGIDLVLESLGVSRPHEIAFADWTFSGVVRNLPRLAFYLADRLGWPSNDGRRPRLRAHLQAQGKPDAAGLRLDIPRKSAVLVWRVA